MSAPLSTHQASARFDATPYFERTLRLLPGNANLPELPRQHPAAGCDPTPPTTTVTTIYWIQLTGGDVIVCLGGIIVIAPIFVGVKALYDRRRHHADRVGRGSH